MPSFGSQSRLVLATVHPQLQEVFNEVIAKWDCKALSGLRTATEQHRLWMQGRGLPGPIVTNKDGITQLSNHQVTWLDKKTGKLYGCAVDVAPYPIQWGDTERFYAFAGYVLGIADSLEIPVRWGGDWDSDRDFHDQKLYDLDHFEIML